MENKSRDIAVVLASGGMDSLVITAIANEDYQLALLHIKYGQRTEKRELKSFNDIADYYKVKKRLIVSIDHLKKIGGSSLTDKSIEIPEGDLTRRCIPSTYVPFRNAHLLCIAVSWAEVISAKKIFIGATEQDSSGYPDCRERFYREFNRLIKEGTKPETDIEVITPLIKLTKGQIVKKGMELNVPFQLSWSCYKDEYLACGRCDSCLLRLKGFKEAGIKDPIKYRL
ncbi:7-cyano-7-deazaguanine synthase QueC [candidate division KSB1 bacterium]|nr:MAG: 7-cyano-7-deazaguanine synthase QueC [candidate division KSB1 bacterium]